MKVKLIISLLLVLCATIYVEAQTDEKKFISDSTIILGILTDDSYVGTNLTDYCSVGYDKAKRWNYCFCQWNQDALKSYSSGNYDFYEIIYKAKTYYIERQSID